MANKTICHQRHCHYRQFWWVYHLSLSVGVILDIMLTDFPPFDQSHIADQRYELIVTGRLMEQLNIWDIFLLQSAQQLNPKARSTMAQVITNRWVATSATASFPLTEPLTKQRTRILQSWTSEASIPDLQIANQKNALLIVLCVWGLELLDTSREFSVEFNFLQVHNIRCLLM